MNKCESCQRNNDVCHYHRPDTCQVYQPKSSPRAKHGAGSDKLEEKIKEILAGSIREVEEGLCSECHNYNQWSNDKGVDCSESEKEWIAEGADCPQDIQYRYTLAQKILSAIKDEYVQLAENQPELVRYTIIMPVEYKDGEIADTEVQIQGNPIQPDGTCFRRVKVERKE